MNRHGRRRAAALSHHVRPGYLHRVLAAQPLVQRGKVYHTMVAHDPNCGIYREPAACDCVPDISLRMLDGVIVVDADGTARKVSTC
jgi:hypothetical protein